MMIATLIGLGLLLFTGGMWVGARMEDRYWADHGGQYRTAVYCNDVFYYVVPEDDYVDMQRIKPWEVDSKLKSQCEICYQALERIACRSTDTESRVLATEALHHAEMRQ